METIKINENQFNALCRNRETMVEDIYTVGMLYLLKFAENTIVSCCAMTWDVGESAKQSKMVSVRQLIEQQETRNIVCTKCGGTNVQCEAWIKPNTNELVDYSDESFSYAFCVNCQDTVHISDVNQNKTEITEAYKKYREEKGKEPSKVVCGIIFKDKPRREQEQEVTFKLSVEVNEDEDDEIFFYCNGIEDLKSLCEYGSQDFMITWFDRMY